MKLAAVLNMAAEGRIVWLRGHQRARVGGVTPFFSPQPSVSLWLIGKYWLCDHRSSAMDHHLSVIPGHLVLCR